MTAASVPLRAARGFLTAKDILITFHSIDFFALEGLLMPLFKTDPRHVDRVFDAYARDMAHLNLPKYRMPDQQSLPETIKNLILDELLLDGNSRQNLATFCTTYVSPEVQELMQKCVDKNMIDQDEYPQTAEIEHRCVHILADLWNAPEAKNAIGCSTTGSSEAAMLGGMALRAKWRNRQKKKR